jgi:hypothetical protein
MSDIPTREEVQQAIAYWESIQPGMLCRGESHDETIVAAARLWLEGPQVDEAMIERAAQAIEIHLPEVVKPYGWRIAEDALRAALEET